MRKTVDIKWFAACATWEHVRELYKVLSKQHHPDRGGDLRTMQEINAEYDELKKNPSRIGTASKGYSGSRSDANDRGHVHTGSKKNAEKRGKGGGATMPADRYTVVFTDCVHKPEKHYVALVFDVADGPHRRHFFFEPWFKHCIYLKYEGEDWQIENTVRILKKITKSNAGFDARAAFEDDDFDEFVGKMVSLHLSEENTRGEGFIKEWQVHVL